MACKLCLGSSLVRESTCGGVTIPFLPRRLREIDKEDYYHKTVPCTKLDCPHKVKRL